MLNSDGLLPPGRQTVTIAQIEQRFVDQFPDSKTRAPLFQRWMQHRQAIQSLVPIVAQWVDGSYVTSKMDPGDIDVVTLIEDAAVAALDPGKVAILETLLDGHNTRDVWGVDSFPITVVPNDSPMASACRSQRRYWTNQWSRVRGNDTASKGFLEVVE